MRKTICVCDKCGKDITPNDSGFKEHFYGGEVLDKSIACSGGLRVEFKMTVKGDPAKNPPDLCGLCLLKMIHDSIIVLDAFIDKRIKEVEVQYGATV